MSERLFVYGTLRPELTPAGLRQGMAGLVRLGAARVRGRLYDLGAYPGAVPDPASGAWILGEVIELPAGPAQLAALDRYEGFEPAHPQESLFVRRRVRALRSGASSLRCWSYVYNRDVRGLPRVPGGDWAAWLRRRESGTGA